MFASRCCIIAVRQCLYWVYYLRKRQFCPGGKCTFILGAFSQLWPFYASKSINRNHRCNKMGNIAVTQLTAAKSQVASEIQQNRKITTMWHFMLSCFSWWCQHLSLRGKSAKYICKHLSLDKDLDFVAEPGKLPPRLLFQEPCQYFEDSANLSTRLWIPVWEDKPHH